MRWNELAESAPGTLVPYDQRSYYKPDPLPPTRSLELDAPFYTTLSEATYWLGQLSGLSRELDFQPLLYTSLLRKEAMESAAIEGADIDYNALYSLETKQFDREANTDPAQCLQRADGVKDTREVLNYEAAVTRGIDAIDQGTSISEALLHELHEVLLSNVPDERVERNTIGSYKQQPNHLGAFLPPAPGAVDGLMDALLAYWRAGGNYHPLIDIALFHYQFETIHPNGDGNGRLGRLLITLQLYEEGYLKRPNLYLSEYFNRNKAEYVDRMEAIRAEGDWEAWLQFFITGIAHQAEEAVDRTIELEDLRKRYEETYGGVNYTKHKVACSLFEQPYLTSKTVQQRFDVTPATAMRAISDLVEEGLLEETTGKERNKEFRAREIFEILERPPTTY
ncbi:Fic family protein [Halobaculum lipolyticum]|uniref:Fic family protein n=1 Tax=Halobaculum lipolyticum TaxID=3032001 RepID=A0ABD5WJF3_9EURY